MLQHNDFTRTRYSLRIALLAGLIASVNPVLGQSLLSAQRTERPAPPTRDPKTPGYVKAKELPDGTNHRRMRTVISSSAQPITLLRKCLPRTADLTER